MDSDWATVATKNKNNKAHRDAVKAEKAAEAVRVAAQKLAERPVPKNKGTVLCRNFVSPEGCKRGDLCNFRHSLEPAPAQSAGGAGAGTSTWRRRSDTAEGDDAQHHHVFHPFLAPTMKERLERVAKLDIDSLPISHLVDVDFSPLPLERMILSQMHAHPVTSDFETSFHPVESNFINLHVTCKLPFPETLTNPSITDFSAPQLQSLEAFLRNESYLSDLAQLGAIFTWAEGDFRPKTVPQFHGTLRVCKFKMLDTPAATRSPLIESMLHTSECTDSEMFFDFHHPVEGAKEEEGAAEVDAGSTLLNVRRRLTPDGKPSGLFAVRRLCDGMRMGLWESYKLHHFNTLWFPFSRQGFRESIGTPGCWYKLPDESHAGDDRYFYLFGFDDRESKKVCEVAPSVEEKAQHKNAKFLRFVEESLPVPAGAEKKPTTLKRRIKATKNRAEASKFFQDGESGNLCLVTGEGETEVKQLVKAPLVRRRNLEDVDSRSNPYFKADLEGLRSLPTDVQNWNRSKSADAPTLEQMRELVLVHPFLPIVAIKKPTGGDGSVEYLAKETLSRLQTLLKGLQDPESNRSPDCEVVVYLSNLQSAAADESDQQKLFGPASQISTAIPGFAAEDFPAAEAEQWKQITGYTWLLPSVFYQSGLLTTEQLAEWLKKFEEKGEKFKVIS